MDYNGSSGVQHIALNTTNIIETVSTLCEYTTVCVFNLQIHLLFYVFM